MGIKRRKLYYSIYYFMIYSFVGWLLETSAVYLDNGYYQSRGFIYGPFCIIYGFGMLMLIIILEPVEDNLFLYFILSTLLISFIEYFTGYYMEAIFKSRLWDYSNAPFNVNGYICLRNSILWGLLSLVIIKCIHPRINKLIRRIPENVGIFSSCVILLFFIINILLSINSNLS